MTQVALMVSST